MTLSQLSREIIPLLLKWTDACVLTTHVCIEQNDWNTKDIVKLRLGSTYSGTIGLSVPVHNLNTITTFMDNIYDELEIYNFQLSELTSYTLLYYFTTTNLRVFILST